MTETSINYAKALYELSVPEEAVLETEKIFRSTPQLNGTLENPLVSLKEKEHVIDRVFPQEMKNFLKVTCIYQKIIIFYDSLEAYGDYSRKQKGILKAVLTYVTKPEEAQKEKMEDFLRREFGAKEVILTLREDKSLIGGFILSAGDKEFDWSLRGRYNNLRQKLTRR